MVINLAFDDPVVWVLIIAAAVFLFGSSKIPQFARSIGQARREFDNGWKGITSETTQTTTSAATNPEATTKVSQASAEESSRNTIKQADPLILAARNEGIDTQGKTREQLAEELSWKLSRK